MTWNYRILSDDGEYCIAEVYYEDGEIVNYSQPVAPYGETIDELMEDMEIMAEALLKPVVVVE